MNYLLLKNYLSKLNQKLEHEALTKGKAEKSKIRRKSSFYRVSWKFYPDARWQRKLFLLKKREIIYSLWWQCDYLSSWFLNTTSLACLNIYKKYPQNSVGLPNWIFLKTDCFFLLKYLTEVRVTEQKIWHLNLAMDKSTVTPPCCLLKKLKEQDLCKMSIQLTFIQSLILTVQCPGPSWCSTPC